MAEAPEEVPIYPIAPRTNGQGKHPKPFIDEKAYLDMYKESIQDPLGFWDKVRDSSLQVRRRGGC